MVERLVDQSFVTSSSRNKSVGTWEQRRHGLVVLIINETLINVILIKDDYDKVLPGER